MSRLLHFLPLLLFALSACSEGGERTRLAEYDFLRLGRDPLYGARPGGDVGLHRFDGGWEKPKGQGLWAKGEARVDLEFRGSLARLRLLMDCPRALAANEQTVELSCNGESVASILVAARSQADTLSFELPMLRQGLNTLSLRPSRDAGETEGAFRLLRLELSAQQNDEQRAEWNRLANAAAADPRWTLAQASAAHESSDSRPRPDVLILLLDTLRADHLSSYGYSRPTAPFLQELSSQGVQLEQVLADAPYTVCSVPSFFTGHSWREHGVHRKEDRLSDEFVTLAELFSANGYATRAISDNPNVSVSHGSDQGFDAFVESWNQPEKQGDYSWRPEFIEGLVDEQLSTLPADRPGFFYVHIMPPHSPYEPGEAHDLFGATDYTGPIHGSVAQIREFDEGAWSVSGAHADRLVALYDGGIHRGDAMAQRIRTAFAALGRDRELVTVVLSDHGEGFGEHGRFGHNSTPYDEMLHVPVILHPRERFAELAESTGVLRSLSDLNALLVRSLQLQLPPEATWPRSYLRVLANPHAEREQIFIRCERPFYALRTPTSLTTLEAWGAHEFFDLTVDPDTANNLRGAKPESYLEGLAQLRAFLERPLSRQPADASELSDEEEARLRSLGY